MLLKSLRCFLKNKRQKKTKKAASNLGSGEIKYWSKHMKQDVGLGTLELPPDRSMHPDLRAHLESKRR